MRKEYPLQTGLKLLPTEIQIKVFEYREKPDAICYGVFLGENSGIDFHKIAHEFWEIHFIKAQNMRLQWQLRHAETKIQLMKTQQEELVRIYSKKQPRAPGWVVRTICHPKIGHALVAIYPNIAQRSANGKIGNDIVDSVS